MLVPEFIINEFMGRNPPDQSQERNAMVCLETTQAVNPIDELMLSSKVIKTGPGGLRSKDEFKPAHRNVHDSHIGILSAVATPESNNVGIISHHTLTPLIVNEYGSYGKKDSSNINGWSVVSANEALIPLINQIYSDRATLAVTHSRQVTPVNNAESPLVITGGEFIIPQIASPRFVHRGKKDGEIFEIVKNETLKVKYFDGTFETFDIIPRKSRTKRGAYISLEMNTLNLGEKFKKNQIIAYTKNFDGKTSMYASGKNVTCAIMNYLGKSHEIVRKKSF